MLKRIFTICASNEARSDAVSLPQMARGLKFFSQAHLAHRPTPHPTEHTRGPHCVLAGASLTLTLTLIGGLNACSQEHPTGEGDAEKAPPDSCTPPLHRYPGLTPSSQASEDFLATITRVGDVHTRA